MPERTLYFAYNYCPEDYAWEGTRYSKAEILIDLNEKEFGCVVSEHEGENLYVDIVYRGFAFSKETGEKLREFKGNDKEGVIRHLSGIPKNADISAIKPASSIKIKLGEVRIAKYGSLILCES